MAGIYLHIPFCRQACSYCNFHFSVNVASHSRILDAMLLELKTVPVTGKKISTIYFGGGTPSVVPFEYIRKMLAVIFQRFDVEEDAEITLEANPDDINEKTANQWIHAGINRLSIGIQTFNDEELKWMNRAHSSKQAFNCLEIIKEAGFNNYSADLIYGSPLQDENILKNNLEILTGYIVPHISAYALTVEPKTALHSFILKGKSADVDPGNQSEAFLFIMNTLRNNGYEHYEISNFSKPGMRSRHNSSYWQGKAYYGIGPGAHSYDGFLERKWNVANNGLYAAAIEKGTMPSESEILTPQQQLNEKIMISLRTTEGLDLSEAENILPGASPKLEKKMTPLLSKGLATLENGRYVLSDKGKLFADGIASDLFF